MGKLDRVIVVALGLCLGCSEKAEPVAAARVESAVLRSMPDAGPTARDPRFDAEGRLAPSERKVSWLEVPRGFRERPGSSERELFFEASDLPFEKVRAYFDARLVPRNASYTELGFEYRSAAPEHTQLELPRVHVTVQSMGDRPGGVLLIIEDLTPSRTPPLPPVVAAEELARRRARQE